MATRYDAIVVGLGAMGSASIYRLAKSGLKVLGIDQFSPPHALGSTHGIARVMRQAIGEGAHYSPLAMRSYELFREMETISGRRLLSVTGMLTITKIDTSVIESEPYFFDNTIAAAREHNIKHDLLDAQEMRRRFPQFKVEDDERGYFEYEAGYLLPEVIVRLQLLLAKQYGAFIHTDEAMAGYSDAGDGVTVSTDQGTYLADNLILATGAWLPQQVDSEIACRLKVYRQTQCWFDISSHFGDFVPPKFPIFFKQMTGYDRWIYGFPALDGPSDGLLVSAPDSPDPVTPDLVNRNVENDQIESVYREYVATSLNNVPNKTVRSATCLITVSPDTEFILDRHPQSEKVIICSPCSGHGFKHSAAIGEAIAQVLTTGSTKIDMSAFKLNRFQKASSGS